MKLSKLYSHIPPYLKNKYILTLLAFFTWMLFFDDNNVLSQYKLRSDLSELKEKRKYYKEQIAQVKADRNDLLTNQKTLEKFAREKYWMKKADEDLFIIVEK